MPPKFFNQQLYPQPNYASDFGWPLIHAVRRRCLDYQHLPSLTDHIQSPASFHGWDDIQMDVVTLLDALRGTTLRTDMGAANSDIYYNGIHGRCFGLRPALEPALRGRVENMLKVIEGEALQLGKDIEMNHFRLKRGDPKGRPEQAFGSLRDQCGMAWLTAIQKCARDVQIFQTGMEHNPSWEEERPLRERMGRGPGNAQGTNGGKL